jgi:hypothetical protein
MKRRTFIGSMLAGLAALAAGGRVKPEPGRLGDDLRLTRYWDAAGDYGPTKLKPIMYGQARGGLVAGEDLPGGAVCYLGCDGRVFNMMAAPVGAYRPVGISGREFKRDEAVTLYVRGGMIC